MPRAKAVPKVKHKPYPPQGKGIVTNIEELVMAVDMSDNTGKVVHSGGKRKSKKVEPVATETKNFNVAVFTDPELVIVACLFFWAVIASFYVAIDLFFFDI